jgi:hypothetical protein
MTNTINTRIGMTLEEAVKEVLVLLTGQDLTYESQYDRYRVIARHLNRALRGVALEHEWSYYSEVLDLGTISEGDVSFEISTDWRFRVKNDDAARVVNSEGTPVLWAYFLPRDALHKYRNRDGLWCSVTRNRLTFSRPFEGLPAGLSVQLPVMREPQQFEIPADPMTLWEESVRNQLLDFEHSDLITARAAWMYAQTDPVMQPRVQTLEEQYNDLKYALVERDDAMTESPYINEYLVPVQSSIHGQNTHRSWPVSNRR